MASFKISYFSAISPRSASCGNLSKDVKAFNLYSSNHSSTNDLASSSKLSSRRSSTKYDHVQSKVTALIFNFFLDLFVYVLHKDIFLYLT